MKKRLLIVGAGRNQIALFEKARRLGIETVGIDGSPDAPGFAVADAYVVADIRDADAITQAAESHEVSGVYPAAEWGVEAGFQAAHRLGLPGLPPAVARCACNKLAMREALEAAGVPNPVFRAARSLKQAEEAAWDIGLPVIVKPVDGYASRGVQRLDYKEDMPLAYGLAEKHSGSCEVLIESFCEGDEFNVDGLMFEGRFILGGITAKVRPSSHHRYDLGIYMPPGLNVAAEKELADTAELALRAIGVESGTAHMEIVVTAEGPRFIEIAAWPGASRIPAELILATYGMDFMADAFRIALGDAPHEQRQFERGTAVYWLPARPGIVSEIVGEDEARQLPEVVELHVHVKPGDEVHHIVDCVTRDRIGYVYTSAENVKDAIAAAERVLEVCRVETRPMV